MTLKRVLLAGLVAGGMIGTAAADDYQRPNGFYLQGGGGANFLDDDNIPNILGTTGGHDLAYESGWLGLGAAGWAFDETLRLEIELGYRNNSYLGVSNVGSIATQPNFVNGDSNTTAFSQMLNVLFDIPLSERVDLSVGGGAGGALIDTDIAVVNPLAPGVVTTAADDSKYAFAYQAIAGLSYQLFPNWQAFVDYRYFATSGADIDASLVPGDFELDYDSHSAVIGLRYFFNDPAPAPAPEPVAQDLGPWNVFFDTNKSNISAAAASTISTAVAQTQDANIPLRFNVVGHTDTVGSASYNDALSLRRAEAVKGELERLGVPANEIAITGRGFSDPLVATGPGVDEPQNRRAEIILP